MPLTFFRTFLVQQKKVVKSFWTERKLVCENIIYFFQPFLFGVSISWIYLYGTSNLSLSGVSELVFLHMYVWINHFSYTLNKWNAMIFAIRGDDYYLYLDYPIIIKHKISHNLAMKWFLFIFVIKEWKCCTTYFRQTNILKVNYFFHKINFRENCRFFKFLKVFFYFICY